VDVPSGVRGTETKSEERLCVNYLKNSIKLMSESSLSERVFEKAIPIVKVNDLFLYSSIH